MANCNDKKRQKLNHKSLVDDDDGDKDSQLTTQPHFLSRQNSLDVVFDCEFLLLEALPYLDTVSIVDKKRVCRQWEEKCDAAINNKRTRAKKWFDDNTELRGAVKRYCKGKRDEIESIAEEYGYPIGKWDVSRVKDFSHVFCDMESFNEDIGAWDVGNATDMDDMFCCARSFNQCLSGWDVSNVKNMRCMFCGAWDFNGDVSTWDTSNVTNMRGMFQHATAFNGDVSSWDTSNATDMGSMFYCASDFNGDLSAWDTSSVNRMSWMFYHAAAFHGDISSWNVSRVTEMNDMFSREDKYKYNQDRLN